MKVASQLMIEASSGTAGRTAGRCLPNRRKRGWDGMELGISCLAECTPPLRHGGAVSGSIGARV